MSGYYSTNDGASIFRLMRDEKPTGYSGPYVVIDPNKDADLSRLWRLLPDSLVSIDQLQAALREYANPKPPRPDEPTDPTARVADRRENIWRLLADGEWVCVDGPDIGTYVTWGHLDAEFGPLSVEVDQ